MTYSELNDPREARQFLLATWALARGDLLLPQRLLGTLRVALELASEGQPIVPLGFISDVVCSLEGTHRMSTDSHQGAWTVPAPDASLVRRYEDYVLGKLSADMSIERAADELQKYKDRDRDRVLAFVIEQIQQRTQLPTVLLGPAAIKSLLAMNSSALQAAFYEALAGGVGAATYQQWDELIQAVRNSGELLGVEDIFELASGTALSKFGQRLALRQVMQAAQHLAVGLPKQKPSGAKRHYAVATNIVEEDLYPVGGFSSIANRGTMESLLRSELAYMETDERPDLFDIKYARDELLYYSRDENQFFRRRFTVLFVLDASLSLARVKDPGTPWQRIVLTLAIVLDMVRSLTDWLASDALAFEILFLADPARGKLQDEREVLEMIFHEEIQAGRLTILDVDRGELLARAQMNARRSLCHCVHLHARPPEGLDSWLQEQSESLRAMPWPPLLCELNVGHAVPKVAYDETAMDFNESSDPWREALRCLLAAVNV